MSRMEEYVLGTVPKSRYVGMQDVPTKSRKEGYVKGMVHYGRNILAVMEDVLIMCRKEDYVSDMERRERGRDVNTKDEPICTEGGVEEFLLLHPRKKSKASNFSSV